ncbi:hypothetical protein KCP75_20390 [Salmonella enterica subsp. enterica]|nr:hypothetical protein KCP75_20390 [Salmonella enterica subsp. enterica]
MARTAAKPACWVLAHTALPWSLSCVCSPGRVIRRRAGSVCSSRAITGRRA